MLILLSILLILFISFIILFLLCSLILAKRCDETTYQTKK